MLPQSDSAPALNFSQKVRPGPRDRSIPRIIRAQTAEGIDLVAILTGIARGKYKANVSNRLTAIGMLLERGFGKVVQPHELGLGFGDANDGELVIRVQRVSARGLEDATDDAIEAVSSVIDDDYIAPEVPSTATGVGRMIQGATGGKIGGAAPER